MTYELKGAKRICDIGAGDIFSSKSFKYWSNPLVKIDVFEPNPILYRSLMVNSINNRNVKVYNLAISDYSGYNKLYLLEYHSYLHGVNSQIRYMIAVSGGNAHSSHQEKLMTVSVEKIAPFDNDDIDVMYLTAGGCEWNILKELKSRPSLIYLCRPNDSGYVLPRHDYIERWIKENNYSVLPKLPDYKVGTQRPAWLARKDAIDNVVIAEYHNA